MFKLFDSKTADPITHHQVGNQSLEVVRTTRKNSMALQIRGNKVVILVPKRHSPQRLIKVLCDNQAWLLQSLMRLEQRRLSYPEAMVFTGNWGDTFDFLGEAVTLVPQDRGGRNLKSCAQVRVFEGQCYVDALQTSQQRCQAIEIFMKQTAHESLAETLPSYARQIGVTHQRVVVKGYKSRWGSCHPDGRLQFNWRLWQAPPWVIEYVMVHELCHLVHPNHSKSFWALVTEHFPQTPEAKRYIKQHGQRWIQLLQDIK